jgi:hypothetical protein
VARSALVFVPLALGCAALAEGPAPAPAPALARHTPLPPRDGTLNWRDPVHGPIYRAATGCYVQLPFPTPPTAMVPPPTEAVPCPPAMQQPAWDQCLHGILSPEGEACTCAEFSNPPPPPRRQPCPT